jgi:hypothetical protein
MQDEINQLAPHRQSRDLAMSDGVMARLLALQPVKVSARQDVQLTLQD